MKRESEKIEMVKIGAVAAICKYGMAGASVSRIAELAGVSDGYLYRHYKGKEELINAVLDNILNVVTDKIEYLLENCSSARDIAEGFLDYLYENSQKNSDMIKFLIIFQNDFSMELNQNVVSRVTNLCKEIVTLGENNGELRGGVTHLDLYMVLVAMPLQFISLKYKGLLCAGAIDSQRVKDYAYNSLFKI